MVAACTAGPVSCERVVEGSVIAPSGNGRRITAQAGHILNARGRHALSTSAWRPIWRLRMSGLNAPAQRDLARMARVRAAFLADADRLAALRWAAAFFAAALRSVDPFVRAAFLAAAERLEALRFDAA